MTAYPPAGPEPACRWCGGHVDPLEVAHRGCVAGFLGRLSASTGVRTGGEPVRVGEHLDQLVRGDL